MNGSYFDTTNAGVIFKKNSFSPVWFSVGNKKVRIEKIHYKWIEKNSSELIYKFTVSNSGFYYELIFNIRSLSWHVRQMAD